MEQENKFNKDFQKMFFFFFWWSFVKAFQKLAIIQLFNRFEFVFIYISAYYLFKLTFSNKNYKTCEIPQFYKFIMSLLLIWIFINIFRDPPQNPFGIIRYLVDDYYVGAWFPLLLFYHGAKVNSWSLIMNYALKINKLFVWISPVIIYISIFQGAFLQYLFVLIFLFPILLVNWDILKKQEKYYLVLSIFLGLIVTFSGGSRFHTLKIVYYVLSLFFLFLIKAQRKNIGRIIFTIFISIFSYFLGNYIYNGGLENIDIGKSTDTFSKFSKNKFENSRETYVYPDFFADMQDINELIYGRGVNGSYYSKIFETEVDKDLNESNSLGVKKGYRTEIECGYLMVILKIGLIGLILKIILALSAIYLGLFKSNNWFVKGCALIIIEWLISMYPAALPQWNESYMLFWLCIGACLSTETRNVKSSLQFRSNLNTIKNINRSFVNINKF